MRLRIEYRPSDLPYLQFHSVDTLCFPREPVVGSSDFQKFVNGDFWAALDDDLLVGFSYILRKPDFAWLARIGVSSTHRGMGIGTRLMKLMVDHCVEIGLPEMILYVESDNEAAIGLYRQFEFRTVQTACQYVLHNPLDITFTGGCFPAEVVQLPDLPRDSWPEFPRDWTDIPNMHNPPEDYVLVFRDANHGNIGYCRLNPGFPGCFPFEVRQPHRNLQPVLMALQSFLSPDEEVLKLTFSSDELESECDSLGMSLNYRLMRMHRCCDSLPIKGE